MSMHHSSPWQKESPSFGVGTVLSSGATGLPEHSLLYIAELVHRINNEYSTVISLARSAAARATVPEERAALQNIIDRLHAYARVHRVMRPGLSRAQMELSEHLSQVCAAMASAVLGDRNISLHIVSSEPILVDEGKCWRVGLIVGEPVTNATRHVFDSGGGSITVELTSDDQLIICSVVDDGRSNPRLKPGLGTILVDALAKELGGSFRGKVDHPVQGCGFRFLLDQRSTPVRID